MLANRPSPARGVARRRGAGTLVVRVALLLSGCSDHGPKPTSWTVRAPMPTARLGLATAVVDGKILAIGGYAEANALGLRTVEAYDPVTDAWTPRTPMPTGRRWLPATAVNGRVYAIGGTSGMLQPSLATVEEYDPTSDTWSTKQPMPTARLGLAVAALNGKIYAVGGVDTGTTTITQCGSANVFGTLEEYDPATDSWTSRQDMPTPRAALVFVPVGGKLYAIGGGCDPGTGSPLVEIYDPGTDAWTSRSGMPTARSGLCGGVVDGSIFVIGGANGAHTSFPALYANNEAYDPGADAWTTSPPLPTARSGLSCAAVVGKVYAIGGATMVLAPHPGVTTVEAFDPTVSCSVPGDN